MPAGRLVLAAEAAEPEHAEVEVKVPKGVGFGKGKRTEGLTERRRRPPEVGDDASRIGGGKNRR